MIKKLVIFVPIIITVVMINYRQDSGKLFQNGKYEQGIANLLLAGKSVTGLGNYDDRLLQKYYIKGLKERKDIVVLGSSRSMYIRKNYFLGKSFFNNSVSQATLNDHIAIYGMYRERRMLPQKVIICLDDWIFSEDNSTDNWRTIGHEYIFTLNIFLPAQEKESIIDEYSYKLRKYYQLFSPSYFHASFFDIIKGNKYQYYSTDKPFVEAANSKLSDGSINNHKSLRQRTAQQAKMMAIAAAAKIGKDETTYNLSPKVREKFEAFVNLILSDGVEIVFFMPPYHPKYFEQFLRASDKLHKIDRYVLNFAAQKRIEVLGSYDPMTATCKEEDFFDEGHLKDSGINKIFLQKTIRFRKAQHKAK